MIVNLAEAPLSYKDGSYGGMAGFKDGIIYNNDCWLVKYPKTTTRMSGVAELQYTTSPLSEYLGSHIYELLGYDVHDTLLCYRNGKIAVACKDFCKSNQLLMEIRTLKNSANGELAELLEADFSSTSSSHVVDLDELIAHLKWNRNLKDIPGITERFWNMVIVDIWINNSDRNNGNWGILRSLTGSKLAPVFDNGASFNDKTPDSKLAVLLADQKRFEGSVLNGSTVFGRDGKKISARQMLTCNLPDLNLALLRNVPRMVGSMSAIVQLVKDIPCMYSTPEGHTLTVCSDVRKDFYIRSLQVRLDKLLCPAFNRAKLNLVQTAESATSVFDI